MDYESAKSALMKKHGFPDGLIDKVYRLASHEEIQKAEMVPSAEAVWLAVTTVTGQERVAAAHLVGRRFAIYLPEIEQGYGDKKHIEVMFPGHLFVFVWGADQHWTRIKACPGVIDILGSLSDADMRAIQAKENELYPLVPAIKIGKKKRWRRTRREEIIDYDNEIISIRPWSAFTDGLRELDSAGRNNLLRRALGV